MVGRVGAGAGGKVGRETHRSREVPGSCLVVRLTPTKPDPCLSGERAGVYLGIKAGEFAYDIPHSKLQQTGNPLTGEQRKQTARPKDSQLIFRRSALEGAAAAPFAWVSCPRTVLVVEPERGGAGVWLPSSAAAGVPAVPRLTCGCWAPRVSFHHSQHRLVFGEAQGQCCRCSRQRVRTHRQDEF